MPKHAPSLGSEIGKKTPFDAPEQEAYLSILRTAAVLSCEFDRLFRRFGLSEAAYNTLRILRGHGKPGIPSQTIGEQLVAAVPDTTRIVNRLVKDGLAARTHSRVDGRQVIVGITPKGLTLLTRLDQPVLDLHVRQLGHVSRADLRAIADLMAAARAKCLAAERGTSG